MKKKKNSVKDNKPNVTQKTSSKSADKKLQKTDEKDAGMSEDERTERANNEKDLGKIW